MNNRPSQNAAAPSPRSPRPHRTGIGAAIERLLPGAPPADAPGEAAQEACCDDLSLGASAASIEAEVVGGEAGQASAILRRVLPDIYFINTPEARSRRHMELLSRLGQSKAAPLLDFYEAPGSPLTECTLCAFDEAAPGLLSKLCGTMAALDLSVHTAFIYTLRLGSGATQSDAPGAESNAPRGSGLALAPASQAEAGRAVALNTFLMSESYFGHDRALTPKTQRKLRLELCRVLSGQADVPALMARSRRSLAPLQIRELSVENRTHEAQTRILLRAGDSFGVLYRATQALASLGLDITAAQVSTREEAADDLFFVTREGAKLPDSELSQAHTDLHARLQGEP